MSVIIPAGTPTPEGYIYAHDVVPVGSQSWWVDEESGQEFPGSHIHVDTYLPSVLLPNRPRLTGPVPFDFRVQLHEKPGKATLFRVQLFNKVDPLLKESVSWDGSTTDLDIWHRVTLPFQNAPVGRWELRCTANIDAKNATHGKRYYNTTRWTVQVGEGGGEYRKRDDWLGSGGWYDGPQYTNVFLHPDDALKLWTSPLTAPTVIRAKARCDSAVGEELFVVVDPRFHFADPGVTIANVAATGKWQNITIDPAAFTPGKHKLFLGCCAETPSKTWPRKGMAMGALVTEFETA